MRKIIFIFCFLILFFLFVKPTLAYDPTSRPNNIFGVHIADTSNLGDVAKLVNSNGGDWGYVTFVIQNGERNPGRWQQAFDQMRRLHLIPIVRIATAPIPGNENVWGKPSTDEIDGWVSFLNSLNWVVKNRYVIVGNEPNHANEWGGEVNPKEYADYLKAFSQKLKNSNSDFFIMPAGFDASAPTTNNLALNTSSMDEALYLEKMVEADHDVFDFVDGWSSHSYPNPGFSGPGDASGKGTVRTYAWELDYLKFIGVSKNLPVVISETGWVHNDNLTTDIGPKIETAFKNVWEKDKRVIAVTPFIFKYVDPPFDTFSWINKNGQYFDFYTNVLNLAKIQGSPIQDDKAEVITGIFPKIATANSEYRGIMFIKNTGESIWNINNLEFTTSRKENLELLSMIPDTIEPGQIGVFLLKGTYPSSGGNYALNILISRDGKVFNNSFGEITNIIPKLPTIPEILDYLKVEISKRIATI